MLAVYVHIRGLSSYRVAPGTPPFPRSPTLAGSGAIHQQVGQLPFFFHAIQHLIGSLVPLLLDLVKLAELQGTILEGLSVINSEYQKGALLALASACKCILWQPWLLRGFLRSTR